MCAYSLYYYTKHCRVLGHLAASYCLLFDRIGNCIITVRNNRSV